MGGFQINAYTNVNSGRGLDGEEERELPNVLDFAEEEDRSGLGFPRVLELWRFLAIASEDTATRYRVPNIS